MKSKPLSHKSENRFRFKTFSQQLAEINVGIVHQIGHRPETPEEGETFFYETLCKWNELNCTESYENFKRDLAVHIYSLPQLVLNQNDVVDCLKKHLQIPGSLCYQPLLELVVALSRDLQYDFYPYFAPFFEIFTKLLSLKDADIVQQVFQTISYVFKFIWRSMIKDFRNVYGIYSSLLGQGQPDYIRKYAAESIAFLLRKVPAKDDLLDLIFSCLPGDAEFDEGVGYLLFEVLRGVQHRFHSNVDQMLYVILSKLGQGLNQDQVLLPWVDVVASQLVMLNAMMDHTTPELSAIIWSTFKRVLSELIAHYTCSSNDEFLLIIKSHLLNVLKLLRTAVSYKRAKLLQCSKDFNDIVLDSLKLDYISDEISQHLMAIVSTLLLSPYLQLDVTMIENLLMAAYGCRCSSEVVFLFTKDMYPFGMFEKVVVPLFLNYCNKLLCKGNSQEKERVLVAFTSIVQHFRPLPQNVEELVQWRSLELFSSSKLSNLDVKDATVFMKILEETLLIRHLGSITNDLPMIWAAIICVPHIKYWQNEPLPQRKLLIDLCNQLLQQNLQACTNDASAFVLCQLVVTFILLKFKDVDSLLSVQDVEMLLMRHSTNTHFLKLAHVYFYHIFQFDSKNSYLEMFLNILPRLEHNIASPFHKVRLFTLKLLSELCSHCFGMEKKENIFDICLSAEEISLNVKEYREKIRFLQELEWGHFKSNKHGDYFEKVPLLYLVGTLHNSFQPLWEPSLKLIESYARGMESEKFWSVYGYYLKDAAELTEKNLKGELIPIAAKQDSHSESTDLSSIFTTHKSHLDAEGRIDYANFRELLWKGLSLFADIAEARNREVSPLLLRFLSNEYYCIDYHQALSQDVSKCFTSEERESTLMVDESVMLLDDTEEVASAHLAEEEQKSSSVKATTNSLCVHLSLFSKFHNPRVIYREPELYALYLKLLIHPSSKVQRLAMACIMNYKHKCLLPYKENFDRLLDEKTFKSEIVSFSIDSGTTAVLPEHREDVLPILMRILFGKMQQHPGSKANFIAQRKAILQFLANSDEGDLKMFIDLTIHPFVQFHDGDLLVQVQKDLNNHNFSAVVPIRKQLGTLQLLGVIFERLAHRITAYLPTLFKILLNITSSVVFLLENRDKIKCIYLHSLKRVRVLAISRIIQFFEMFENYPFSKEEIDALFIAAIWPQLPHFAEELTRCSSTLLKLFKLWSSNPRYFVLLQKHSKGNVIVTPLRQIMELLANTNSANSLSSVILEMIENLITLEDYNSTSQTTPEGEKELIAPVKGPLILINNELPVSREEFTDWSEPPNYGTLIVLPHMKTILIAIKIMIEKMGKKPNKSQVPERPLLILSRLSEFVSEDDYCSEMIRLLLPFLTRKIIRSEDVELNVFTILSGLLKRVENPKQFVRTFAGMFSSRNSRQSRSALCNLFLVIAQRDPTLSCLSTLVTQLNAWDARRLEEPDFSLRISGFQYAVKTIEFDESLDPLFYLLVIYNCCYTIHSVDDMSLRDNASHCLQRMIDKFKAILVNHVGFVKEILLGALLPEICRGIRAKPEVVRHEFITVLSACVQKCQILPLLKDLQALKNEDVDLDFFENIIHIQIHRRARAMLKLAHSGVCEKLRCETLMQFVLPLASSFPLNEMYEKNNTLVDAAVELIGSISHYIPWYHYENLLNFYLRKLLSDVHFQKTKVKILLAILDGFHFDVSSHMHESDDKLIPPPSLTAKSLESDMNIDEGIDSDSKLKDVESTDSVQHNSNDIKHNTTVSSSSKIYNSIIKSIIPQLHKCLTRKSNKDEVHHLSKQHFTEDEVLRAPVAIAMVKLMQHLPKGVLERSLPGVFFKICTFLKSRAESVRKVARSTLVTIMKSLGVKFLHFLIKEMKQILSRGYQVHVMTFTINSVLLGLKSQLKSGDLDSSNSLLIEICHNELFGSVAEEKLVDQIVGKLLEAKSTKAYSTYAILANFISHFSLVNLILPLKQVLAEITNHAFIHKARECLRHIILGLVENSGISSKNILIFCHAAMNECLSNLNEKRIKRAKPLLNQCISRPDTFLVEKEPSLQKVVARSSACTNNHIFVEFGLQLLYFNLKRGTICTNNQDNLEMLDPFVHQLNECLNSPHIPLITSSLRILIWLMKCPLPSLKKLIKEIAHSLFALLKKYSHDGIAQGSCGEMIITCFKAVAILIKRIKFHTIDENQLKLLLLYIEHDIYDSTKQATAFTLLKAVLSRQLVLPEVHEMMKKIMEISITSAVEHIRIQCRQCILLYMLHYPIGKKLDRHIRFIVAQLEYTEEYGRESALEMLTSVFETLPQNILDMNAELCFIPMAVRMVNDDSSKCRNMTALALKMLIEKVSANERSLLFSVVQLWLQDEKHLHRQLASQLCGLFVDVEKEQFSGCLASIFPLLIQQLENPKQEKMTEDKYDHLIFLTFTTLRKILVNCNVLHDPVWCDQLNTMWEFTHKYLLHPHIWNRLITSQMFGILFAAYPVDVVVTTLTSGSSKNSEYFLQNFPTKLASLVTDFCGQLKSAHLLPEIHEQVAKNLVYLAKVIQRLPDECLEMNHSFHQKEKQNMPFKLSLPWLIKKLRHEARDEIINTPKTTLRRACFFKWVAAVAADLGKEALAKNLSLLMPLLLREVNDNSPGSDSSLKSFTQEIVDLVQSIVGIEAFSKEYATAQLTTNEKKASRKRGKAMQVVTDPQVAAWKKIKKNLLKREALKRKVASYHPGSRTVKKSKFFTEPNLN